MPTPEEIYSNLVNDMHLASLHTLTVISGMTAFEQGYFLTELFKDADAVVVLYPSAGKPHNLGVLCIKGGGVLAAAGFIVERHGLDAVGRNMPVRKTPLANGKVPQVVSFLADTFIDAEMMGVCWGDSRASERARRKHRRDGGEQAIENMRAAVTPKGRAFLERIGMLKVRSH